MDNDSDDDSSAGGLAWWIILLIILGLILLIILIIILILLLCKWSVYLTRNTLTLNDSGFFPPPQIWNRNRAQISLFSNSSSSHHLGFFPSLEEVLLRM